ncbi:MAG TPA: lipase family protein [Verrucomicrobiae bacterium]|nr:lipase family protein [Verrucomicrobiae bacterium]
MQRLRIAVSALLMFTLTGCGSGAVEEAARAVAAFTSAAVSETTDIFTAFTLPALLSLSLPGELAGSLGGGTAPVGRILVEAVGTLQPYLSHGTVRSYRVAYRVPGSGQNLSGLVIVPVPRSGGSAELPILSLQHPTQVLRSQSPSLVPTFRDEELTVPLATLAASMGYIVLVPDYPGLGTNHDVHPYCMKSLEESVTGLIEAATAGNQPWSSKARWDGRIFLMGYSEGGYASLVTARAVQEKHPAWNLAGVAPLDGPYHLSGTMRDLLLESGTAFSAPYFVPMLAAAYGAAYGATSPLMQFDNAVTASACPDGMPLNRKLLPMLDGSSTSDQINEAILGHPSYTGPASILSPAYIDALRQDSGVALGALRENDAYRGWTPRPSMRVRFFHHAADDLVPVGNMDSVRSAWGGLPNVAFEEFTDAIPGVGSVHAGALVPATLKGLLWIDSLAYPLRH